MLKKTSEEGKQAVRDDQARWSDEDKAAYEEYYATYGPVENEYVRRGPEAFSEWCENCGQNRRCKPFGCKDNITG